MTLDASAIQAARASMGPRFFNRGNQHSGLFPGPVVNASMGPRFFNRGNQRCCCRLTSCLSRLQWGRGFSTAEIRPSQSGLQPAAARFNGAAVFQPRKYEWPGSDRIRQRRLQWGRGFSTAEIRKSCAPASRMICASMGPRFFNRGNCQHVPAELLLDAASMGPRFFNRGNEQAVVADELSADASMGPRFFNRGNSITITPSTNATE